MCGQQLYGLFDSYSLVNTALLVSASFVVSLLTSLYNVSFYFSAELQEALFASRVCTYIEGAVLLCCCLY